jgi:FkbM family methyltransferase
MSAMQVARKSVYRWVRYHWLTEFIQYLIRRSSLLRLPAIKLELEVKPGEVIIDCGANVGDITSLFARAGAEVYAFEPNPTCFRILSRRFAVMRMVHCFNKGVMDRKCVLTLSTPGAHAEWDAVDTTVAATFIPPTNGFGKFAVQQDQVECIDLSDFIRSLGKRVRLLKLDIEGSELPVLNHLMDNDTMSLIDLVLVETHENQMPQLAPATGLLRERIRREGLEQKIRLDWY